MTGEIYPSFGNAIKSESRLAVIRIHTTPADEKLCDECTGWTTTADG